MKVRVRGVNQSIRWIASVRDSTRHAARLGCIEAAQYLMDVIKEKFGRYQPTGGTNGGAWAKLTYDTNIRKLIKWGFSNKPLIASGDMKESFYVNKASTSTAISASVASDDPKLVYHVYGAPRANVPQRDPMLITAIEERDMCHDIIRDEINKVFLGG